MKKKIICTNLGFYQYKLYKHKLFRLQDPYVNNNEMCFNNIDKNKILSVQIYLNKRPSKAI